MNEIFDPSVPPRIGLMTGVISKSSMTSLLTQQASYLFNHLTYIIVLIFKNRKSTRV